MTGSYADTYRVFSNNADKPWVDENKQVQIYSGSNLDGTSRKICQERLYQD